MTCANCTALRERVRVLERELGLRVRDGAIAALVIRWGLEPMGARVALVLYEAKGRTVANEHLIEAAGVDNATCLGPHVLRIRKAMGQDAIVNTRGLGYAMGPPGISKVLAAIHPPELQDVRG